MRLPRSDYGKLHLAGTPVACHAPTDTDEAGDIVALALQKGRRLRVRGSGHSLSGMSLPRNGEVLLLTGELDAYRMTAPGRLVVGAGAVLWDIRDFVAARGWQMPVYNGGWAGPTVGGYVNAGGMGLRVPPTERLRATASPSGGDVNLVSVSEIHGGFWEHVHAIEMVDGTGTRRRITETDADFPWLFAACGQFGVLLEVELKLQRGPGPDLLPTGASGRIPRSSPVSAAETDDPSPETGMPWLYWFSVLLPEAEEAAAWDVLGRWCQSHGDILTPRGGWVGPVQNDAPIGFRYRVASRRFTPPLLYPRHEDFLLLGVMAEAQGVGQIASDERLVTAERAFVADVLARGWSLYAPAENLSRSLDYASYLGAQRMARFEALKAFYDPDRRLNPGEIISGDAPGPLRTSTARKMVRAMARSLGTGNSNR